MLAKNMIQEYSCITADLYNVPYLVDYDENEVLIKCGPFILPYSILLPLESTYCIVRSLQIIKNSKHMSLQLAQMHKRFLYQLILQVTLPIGILIVPILLYLGVIYFKLFNFGMSKFPFQRKLILFIVFAQLVLAGIATFSVAGGTVLVVFNPQYSPFLDRFRRKKTPRNWKTVGNVVSPVLYKF